MPFNVNGGADVVAVFGADTSGFDKGIDHVEGGITKAAANISSKLGSIGGMLTAGLTLPILAIGAGLLKVATDFDDAFDRIRIGTGATGAALAGLEQSFRNVVADVPASFEAASQAITELAQRTGLTGAALELLTKQELELARMTGAELGPQIEATSKLFTNWAGAIESPTAAMDFLFKVSQQTGIGVTKLAGDMTKAGAPLRALGLGFNQSAVLVAQFDKAGVDAGKMTMALTRALKEMSDKGIKDPEVAFGQLIDKIKNAETNMKALGIATEVFGSRGAVQMVDAIKAGRFEIDEMAQALGRSKESILAAAAFTNDYSENLQILGNRVKLAAEPLAKEFFEAINRLIPTFTKVISGVTSLIQWFTNLSSPVKTATVVMLALAAVAGPIAVMAGAVIRSLATIGTAMGTLKGHAVSLGVTLSGVLRTAGLFATREIDLKQWGGTAASSFTRAAGSAKQASVNVDELGAHLTELAFIAGKTTKADGGLAESMGKTGDAMKGLGEKAGKGGGAAKGISELAAALESVNKWSSEVGPKIQFTEAILHSMSTKGRTGVLALSAAFVTLKNSINLMAAEMSGGQGLDAKVRAAFDKLIAHQKVASQIIVAEIGKINSAILELPVFYEKGTKGALEILRHMAEAHATEAALIVEGDKNMAKAAADMAEETEKALEKTRDSYDEVFDSILGKWADFANKTLGVLHGLNKSIPATLGGMVEALAKVFGASTAQAQKWAQGITSIVGGVQTFMGSRNQGKVAGVMGGAMAGLSMGATIGSIFPGIGTAVGAGIGAAAGAIIGLFGSGKSAAQKAEEERQKKAAEVQTSQAIANLTAGIIDGLEKGRQLLENLAGFVAVPKQAIKKFFKQLETLLVSFVEMSAQFKSDGLAKAKEVADNLGPVFGFLMSAVDFSKMAREIEDVSDEAINKLMSAISRLEAGFEKIIEKMDKTTVARAARLAGKLTTVFSFLAIIPETLKQIVATPDVTDAILERIFANATALIDKFSAMVDTFHDYSMSKLAKNSKQFTAVFESVAAVVGALKAIGEYQPIPDEALDAVTSDIQRVTTAIGGWVDMGNIALEKALSLEDVVRRLRESLARSLSGLSDLMRSGAETAQAVRSQGGTTINRTDQSVHIGGITAGSPDPRVRELYEFVQTRFGGGGIGQIASSR